MSGNCQENCLLLTSPLFNRLLVACFKNLLLVNHFKHLWSDIYSVLGNTALIGVPKSREYVSELHSICRVVTKNFVSNDTLTSVDSIQPRKICR